MKNDYRVENDIVYIELNCKDGSKLYTMIDKDDLEIVDKYKNKWFAHWSKFIKSYYCDTYNAKQLHRIIMNCPKGLQVDHINHNTLDNRKCNLRIVTVQENCFNRRIKGYCWNKQAQKWHSQISTIKKLKHLGLFDNEQAARNAYLEAKAKYHIIEER